MTAPQDPPPAGKSKRALAKARGAAAKAAKQAGAAPQAGRAGQAGGATAPGGARARREQDARQQPGDRVVRAEFAAGAKALNQFPPPALVELAFAGRSNVGKSSLMNKLLERRTLVRTSSTPGCTRQISWFEIEAGDGAQLHLVDLPGYGYAKRSKSERSEWGHLIDGYLMERPTLRGVLLLVDIRRGPEEDDRELLRMLAEPGRTSRPALEVTVVATKLDKLPRAQHKTRLEEISRDLGLPVFGFSALDGSGRGALWRRVRSVAGLPLTSPEAEADAPAAPDPSPAAEADASPPASGSSGDSAEAHADAPDEPR